MTLSLEASRTLNALGMLAVCIVLLIALFYQFYLQELPCALCLLQRVGFVAVGFGLSLNLLYGPRPHHYALMIIAAMFGGGAAIRQILLHIVPGTGHYGAPFLGLHYYTWAAICFFLVILGSALMLLFESQYEKGKAAVETKRFGGNKLAAAAFFLMLFLGIANAGSTLLQCGFGICDDPPTNYKMLETFY